MQAPLSKSTTPKAKKPKSKGQAKKPAPNPKTFNIPSQNVNAVVAKGMVRTTQRPMMTSKPNGDITVQHREYIADFNGSVTFASNTIAINPGLSQSFPWLASVAQNFESYLFKKLKYCYETEAPTTATGTLMLAIDYDASDNAPSTKAQIMAYRRSVRSPPWNACCYESEAKDLQKLKSRFVRNGAVPANTDVKLYDTGNLFLCTQGQANTNNIGELYVEYVVELMTPQIGDVFLGQSIYGEFTNNGGSNANPFGTKTGNLPATAVSTGTTASVTTFTFTSPWRGVFSLNFVGTGLSAATFGGTATTVTTIGSITNAGTTQGVAQAEIKADVGQTVTITINNTTITSSDVLAGQGAFS